MPGKPNTDPTRSSFPPKANTHNQRVRSPLPSTCILRAYSGKSSRVRFNPPLNDFGQRRLFRLHILGILEVDQGPILRDPLQESVGIPEFEAIGLLHFGPAMEHELDAVLGAQVESHAIFPIEAEAGGFPFDVLGDVRIRCEDDGADEFDFRLQRVVLLLDEGIHFGSPVFQRHHYNIIRNAGRLRCRSFLEYIPDHGLSRLKNCSYPSFRLVV